MCGIIGVISKNKENRQDLISGLKRLEYRGYDSTGIAFIDSQSSIQRIRSVGRIANLISKLKDYFISSHIGIGHTRWATTGKVTESNAHPHLYDGIAIVHNGIIENYQNIKENLVKKGHIFETETDSEVIAHLIANYIKYENSFKEAIIKTVNTIKGNFAFVAISEKFPDTLIGTRHGAPLSIGISSDKLYLASDSIALSSLANDILYLEDNDIAILENNKYEIIDFNNKTVNRTAVRNNTNLGNINHKGFDSFMLKEIFEEEQAVRNTFNSVIENKIDISKFKSIYIIGCGTSYYAAVLAKYWIEENLRIPTFAEIASEFRYRNPILIETSLYILISQSGETSDTLGSLKLLKNMKTLALVNVQNSSIAREASNVLYMNAGPEIGVASTKNLISQITALLCLSKKIDIADIVNIQVAIKNVTSKQFQIRNLADKIIESKALFYIGRGTCFPIALEGALKVKELSYIQAQGLEGGELKHGSLAVIDSNVYTIALAPMDQNFSKMISNIDEILARNGKVIIISSDDAKDYLNKIYKNNNLVDILYIPIMANYLYYPFVLTTTVHLLAYYVAKIKGADVDKPRNLAKSVTVE